MLRTPRKSLLTLWCVFFTAFLFSQAGLAQEEAPPPAESSSAEGTENAPQDYVSLGEPMIVNVLSNDSIHFLQVAVELKLKDPALAEAVQLHTPAIKHQLIMIFSEKKFFEMQSIDGKKKMRDEALKAVQDFLKDKTGDTTVENIFFTSLIVQ